MISNRPFLFALVHLVHPHSTILYEAFRPMTIRRHGGEFGYCQTGGKGMLCDREHEPSNGSMADLWSAGSVLISDVNAFHLYLNVVHHLRDDGSNISLLGAYIPSTSFPLSDPEVCQRYAVLTFTLFPLRSHLTSSTVHRLGRPQFLLLRSLVHPFILFRIHLSLRS